MLRMLALAGVVFICALVLLLSPLPPGFPPPSSPARNRMAAIMTGIVAMGGLVWLAASVTGAVRGAGLILDPLLAGRGLTGHPHLVLGRRYTGMAGAQRVEVTYLPAAGLQPAQVDLYVYTDLGSRAALGSERPLLDCRDCPRVILAEPPWHLLHIHAADESWIRAWLSGVDSGSVLHRLVDDLADAGSWALYVQPDRLWLHVRAHGLAPARFEAWLDGLLRLAQRTP